MNSCLYVGQVKHRRRQPARHEFAYRLFMLYLDLDEVPRVFQDYWLWSTARANVAWFRRSDHLGDAQVPLSDAVRELVATRTGFRPRGPIRLLTHLRYFGFGFNPVSFYYCFDAAGERVETIVAEVNNTPWGEQYCYVLGGGDADPSGRRRFQPQKNFHVSPFMPMEIDYDWRFSTPDEHLFVHMQSHQQADRIFDATLTLERRTISSTVLVKALAQFPLMTVKVVAAIYYQALRLWLKRVPYYAHPDKLDSVTSPEELSHESRRHL